MLLPFKTPCLLGALAASLLLLGCTPTASQTTCEQTPPPPSGSCPSGPTADGDAPQDVTLDGGIAVHQNLTFTHVPLGKDGIALQGDLYVPDAVSGQKAGLVVLVHGGAGADCDRRRDAISAYAEQLARDTGAGVFNVEYRLTREGGGYPNDVKDVICAAEWISGQAGTYGLDGQRMALVGESTGGSLALDVALERHRTDLDPDCGTLPPIISVVSYSAPVDFPVLTANSSPLAQPILDAVGPCNQAVSSCDVGRACNRCMDASPIAHACVSGNTTRYTLVQAPNTFDPVVSADHATAMSSAFELVGAAHQVIIPLDTQLQDRGCTAGDNAHPAHGFFTACLFGATEDAVSSELTQTVGPVANP
jgi:acetyl esterase/lipase